MGDKQVIRFSMDLMCAKCFDTRVPIKYDRATNTWWHKCGWSERAEKPCA